QNLLQTSFSITNESFQNPDSAELEVDDTSQNLLQIINSNISTSSNVTLNEAKTCFPSENIEKQYFSSHQDDHQEDDNQDDVFSYYSGLQHFEKSSDQDNFQGSDDVFSDCSGQENYDESDDLSEEDFVGENNVTDFIFEKPMSQLSGIFENTFSPYFTNFTEMSFFTWVTKHSISTAAYQELVTIILHSQFNSLEMPRNIRTLKQYRLRLPTLPIRQHKVRINIHKSPSTSLSSKIAYTLSIIDYIKQVLKNPKLFSKMYFGPGIEGEDRMEFWHRRIWSESPLLSDDTLKATFPGQATVIYRTGSFISYVDQQNHLQVSFLRAFVQVNDTLRVKVQQLLKYSMIPAHLRSAERCLKSKCGCLWLVDERFVTMSTTRIRSHVKIWFMDQPEPKKYEYFVDEIIYQHNRSWMIHPIHYRHRHPNETMSLPPIPSNLRCLRIFIDLYHDDFGTFRNVYHSLGGVYVQFGNMPFHLRKLLKNYFPIGFVPFGASFSDFIEPFIADMQTLQNGIRMTLYNGEEVYIRGGLGVVTADLPQGNDLSEVKRHSSNRGYRSCEAETQELTNYNYDIIRHARYHHITNMQFSEIESQKSLINKIKVAKKYGLCLERNILDRLYYDRHQQCPQDIYHAMARKIKRLTECTLVLFNDKGNDAFLKIWKSIKLPKFWSKLPNPITHQRSFMMSDLFHLAMLMPFILSRFLTIQHIKENMLTDLLNTTECSCQDQSFVITFSKDDYFENLSKALKKEYNYLIKVFPEEFLYLPNLHVNTHLVANAKNYRTLVNTACSVKRYNTLQALRFWLDGGQDECVPDSGCYTNRSLLEPLLSEWFITKSPDLIIESESEDNETNEDNDNSLTEHEKTGFHVKVKVGDIVELKEISDLDNNSFALVKAIITHHANNGQVYAFFIFDWFEDLKKTHPILECEQFRLQHTNNHQWRRIFTISMVEHQQRYHFLHDCKQTCDSAQHDQNNRNYLHNDFYFKTI
ncbi:23367_t:CDS:2, partial [Racocetra persica]